MSYKYDAAGYAWQRTLKSVEFEGSSGKVSMLPSGDRLVNYRLYQNHKCTKEKCYATFTGDGINGTIGGESFTASWNLRNFPGQKDPPKLRGQLGLYNRNIYACYPYPSNVIRGKVVIVMRGGGCGYAFKAWNVMRGGGIALLTVNMHYWPTSSLFMRDEDPVLTIPGYGLPYATGGRLINTLYRNSSARINVTLPSVHCIEIFGSAASAGFIPKIGTATYDIKGKNDAFVLPSKMTYNGEVLTKPSPVAIDCGDGEDFNVATRTCQDCKIGTYRMSYMAGGCQLCRNFTFANETGSSVCKVCPPGKTAKNRGSHNCTDCPKGQRGTEGVCFECRPGSFTDERGQADCQLCPRGRFATSANSFVCTKCPGTQTTRDVGSKTEKDCGCPPDHLYISDGSCRHCSVKSTTCPGYQNDTVITSKEGYALSPDLSNTRRLQAGRRKSPHAHLPRSYQCGTKDMCPAGQLPGVCPLGYTGRACADCIEDYYPDKNKCKACGDGKATRELSVTATVVALLIAPVIILKIVTTPRLKYVTATFSMATILGIFVSFLQISSLTLSLDVDWPDIAVTVLKPFEIVAFELDYLGLSCTLGQSYSRRIMIKAVVVVLGMIVMVHAWALGWILPVDCAEKSRIISVRKPKWGIVNGCGLLGNVAFVPISMSAFRVFDCYKHPDGGESIRSMPAVLCYESVWVEQVLPASIFCMMISILTFSGYTAIMFFSPGIKNAGAKLGFLYGRFKPDGYYWNGAMMTRNLLLASAPCYSSNSYLVAICMVLVCLGYLLLCVMVKPWKLPLHTFADSFSVTMIIITITAGISFTKQPGYTLLAEDAKSHSSWTALRWCTTVPFAATFLVLLTVLWVGFRDSWSKDLHTEKLLAIMPDLALLSRKISKLASGEDFDMEVINMFIKNAQNLSLQDLGTIEDSIILVSEVLLGHVLKDSTSRASKRKKMGRRVATTDTENLNAKFRLSVQEVRSSFRASSDGMKATDTNLDDAMGRMASLASDGFYQEANEARNSVGAFHEDNSPAQPTVVGVEAPNEEPNEEDLKTREEGDKVTAMDI
eukprot:TRINITY_DN109393_c0_g1_i1.p1 TRINITY_DN109393_c0_g1~~TRINITY_DN109393_c0_g1_i1.p1  ORF type:complete len:1105 (+),score=110.47 TRINITY_DN109393_c0_g1_i1:148-3315(+)